MAISINPTKNATIMTRSAWCAWIAHIPPSEPETGVKRHSLRRAIAAGPVQIRYGRDGRAGRQACWVLEVSANGLTLRALRAVPERDSVEIWWPEQDGVMRLRGTIAHCTGSVGGYKLGVTL